MNNQKITHDEPWREYIDFFPAGKVRKVDDVLYNENLFPGNVSPYHMKRQLILADIFSSRGDTDVRIEKPSDWDNLRYDVYAKSPNGHPIVAEVGELNTPSRDIADRFRKTYDSAEIVYWWHNNGFNIPIKYINSLQVENCFHCEICTKERGKNAPLYFWKYQLPQDENTILYFDLMHMFEPGRWHNMTDGFGDSNGNSRIEGKQVSLSDL